MDCMTNRIFSAFIFNMGAWIMDSKGIVVLGSGMAGYSVIRELRKLDRDIPVTLVTRDSGDYYSKPMLSNAYAQGKDAAGLVLTCAAEMAAQLGITLLAETEVHAIDRTNKTLASSAGELAYDRLVFALGATPSASRCRAMRPMR
jgi:rubredoxin-NAD+ reductase